jgi:hypothetical protein
MSIVGAGLHAISAVTVPVIKKAGDILAPAVKSLEPALQVIPAAKRQKIKDFAVSVKPWVTDKAHYLSVHDKLKMFSNSDTANKFVNNSPEGLNDSIAAHADFARLSGHRELQGLSRQLDIESGMTNAWGRFAKRGKNMPVRKAIEKDAYLWMQEAYRLEGMGQVLPPHANAAVNRVVESYQKSGFAEKSWQRMADSNMDMQLIRKSKNYTPVNHNAHKYVAFAAKSKNASKALSNAVGEQIAAHYPKLVDPAIGGLSHAAIGKAFLKTQRDSVTRAASTPFHGATMDEVGAILDAAGATQVVKDAVMRDIKPKLQNAGKPQNLKPRIGWDFTKQYATKDGESFSLGDFVSHNMETDLHSYNMTTGSRVGLAKKDIFTTDQLTAEMNAISDAHLGDVIKHRDALKFTDDLKNDLLGYAVGERPSALQRGASQVAALLSLRMSGIYNIAEFTASVETFGYKAVLKHALPAMKNIFKDGVNMTPDVAEKITAIVAGNLRAEGRFKSVVGRLESDHMADVTGPFDWMNTAAQSTHYLNMSEWIRRVHLDVIAGAQADLLEEFVKGNVASGKYLDDIGMNAADKTALMRDIGAHGLYTEKWDQRVAEKLAVSLTRDTDRMAMMVRKGETPAFLAHSDVGRMLFPYFSFTAGANQKILRRAHNKDGAIGVAQMMIHQAPLAVLAAMAANVLHGDDYDKDLATKALSIAPGIGYGALPLSMMTRGSMGGAATPFTAINSAANLVKAVGDGDIKTATQNIPGLSILLPVQIINSAFPEED